MDQIPSNSYKLGEGNNKTESGEVGAKTIEDEDLCFKCSFCDRVFNISDYRNARIAEHARDQHEHKGHPQDHFICSFCQKEFLISNYRDAETAKRACDQHEKNAHEEEEDEEEDKEESTPDPPVSSPGKWVPLAVFIHLRKQKSFGYFKCPCGKFWVSAHAQPIYKQVSQCTLV
jgi:hypothetical protein